MPYSGGTPRHVRESCCPGLHTVTTSSPDRLHLGPVICRWLLRRGGRERVRPATAPVTLGRPPPCRSEGGRLCRAHLSPWLAARPRPHRGQVPYEGAVVAEVARETQCGGSGLCGGSGQPWGTGSSA